MKRTGGAYAALLENISLCAARDISQPLGDGKRPRVETHDRLPRPILTIAPSQAVSLPMNGLCRLSWSESANRPSLRLPNKSLRSGVSFSVTLAILPPTLGGRVSTREEDDRCNEPPRVGAACPASGADPLWCETRGWSSQSQERAGARRRLSWHCQGAANYSRSDGSLCRVGFFNRSSCS